MTLEDWLPGLITTLTGGLFALGGAWAGSRLTAKGEQRRVAEERRHIHVQQQRDAIAEVLITGHAWVPKADGVGSMMMAVLTDWVELTKTDSFVALQETQDRFERALVMAQLVVTDLRVREALEPVSRQIARAGEANHLVYEAAKTHGKAPLEVAAQAHQVYEGFKPELARLSAITLEQFTPGAS